MSGATVEERQCAWAVSTALSIEARVTEAPTAADRRMSFEPLEIALIVDALRGLSARQDECSGVIFASLSVEAMAFLRARHAEAIAAKRPVSLSVFEALSVAALLFEAVAGANGGGVA